MSVKHLERLLRLEQGWIGNGVQRNQIDVGGQNENRDLETLRARLAALVLLV